MYAQFRDRMVDIYADNGARINNIRTRHPVVSVYVSGDTVVVNNVKGGCEVFKTNGTPVRYTPGRR